MFLVRRSMAKQKTQKHMNAEQNRKSGHEGHTLQWLNVNSVCVRASVVQWEVEIGFAVFDKKETNPSVKWLSKFPIRFVVLLCTRRMQIHTPNSRLYPTKIQKRERREKKRVETNERTKNKIVKCKHTLQQTVTNK